VALARSSLCLGLLGRERLYYWRLVLWTFLRRPGLFACAISMAICGHHFRLMCKQLVR
jgi:hypothetical protein